MIEGFVEPSWVASRHDDLTVVDVREPGPYEELGHVPGAVNIPYDRVRNPAGGTAGHLPDPATIESLFSSVGIEPTDTLVFYDDAPAVYAARVALTADAYGHDGDIYVLDGGFEAYSESHEIETGAVNPDSSTYSVAEPGHPIVDREHVDQAVEDEGASLVDTRTAAEYESAAIPDSIHLSWEDLVENNRLKSTQEIQATLSSRGIEREDEIVLYCNTARRLSHTYTALTQLGYENVVAYEGSLTDWIRKEAAEWSPDALAENVRKYADDGFEAMVENLGEGVIDRLKLVGLYHQKHRGYFMIRTRIPGGVLTAEQAEVIGTVADDFARAPPDHGGESQNPEWGDGFLDITTRQDIQMHWVEIQDIPEIWDRYESVGLTTFLACGNSVRNVVSCPASGVDPEESADVRSIVQEVSSRFQGDEKYANLPRKLKVSVTGCHENCGRAQINDLGLLPATKDGTWGFNVYIGGGLSDGPRMARDLDLFVEPDNIVNLVESTADLFIDHGSYLDTAVNRLRFLVADWGVPKVREELAARAEFVFTGKGEGLTDSYRGDHVGVHDSTNGNKYVGFNVPVGRMGGAEFARFGDLAAEYGNGEIRLSPAQNFLLPGVDPADVDSLLAADVTDTYSPNPGPFERGAIACTGKEFCTYGIIDTKNRTRRWVRELDQWYEDEYDGQADPDAVRIHLSGCSASCAHPQIGDIGLRGEEIPQLGGSEPAVDVGLGGDLGEETFVDWVAGSQPTDEFVAGVKRILDAYGAEADPDEAFSQWVDRTDPGYLHELVTDPQQTPTPADD